MLNCVFFSLCVCSLVAGCTDITKIMQIIAGSLDFPDWPYAGIQLTCDNTGYVNLALYWSVEQGEVNQRCIRQHPVLLINMFT